MESKRPLFKQPSAFIPILVSLTVLALMLLFVAISGTPKREPDEGVGAHLFQIWLFLEILMVGLFAIKWLPQQPKQTVSILIVQILAILAVCTPVFLLKL